jgi:hypothetical protein
MRMSSDGLRVQFYFQLSIFVSFILMYFLFRLNIMLVCRCLTLIPTVCDAFLCLLLMNLFACGNLSVS